MRSETITLYTEDGGEEYLPTVWAICENCHGNGVHVNRAIDGDGISSDDECWQDEQFTEMYFSGGYDVRCDAGCENGKIRVVDEERCSPAQLIAYYQQLRDEYDYRCECEMERRMGA